MILVFKKNTVIKKKQENINILKHQDISAAPPKRTAEKAAPSKRGKQYRCKEHRTEVGESSTTPKEGGRTQHHTQRRRREDSSTTRKRREGKEHQPQKKRKTQHFLGGAAFSLSFWALLPFSASMEPPSSLLDWCYFPTSFSRVALLLSSLLGCVVFLPWAVLPSLSSFGGALLPASSF